MRCPSGARTQAGWPVEHPAGTTTGACESWHVEQERAVWETQQSLPAYWDGEGWDSVPPELQQLRHLSRYRDYRA